MNTNNAAPMNDELNNAGPDNDQQGNPEGFEKDDATVRDIRVMKIKADSPLEAAATIVSSLGLCPRDMVGLGAALICTVVDDANEADKSPFHHISTDLAKHSPFAIAIQALQEVESWGNHGADVPTSAMKDRPAPEQQ